MSRILVIEDDQNILDLEKDYLEANGFETVAATDGNEGLTLAVSQNFDLVLLDVMLPGTDGFEICRQIREVKNIPIIFVTAKREETDKIIGLGYGADDYIIKPFSPGELVARIKAHIARYKTLVNSSGKPAGIIESGNMRLCGETGEAFINDTELSLTKKEFAVLYLLARNPNKIFSKTELFESVWGYDSLGDTSTLTVHINRLREKIREVDPDAEFIKTVWGRGYKFT